MCGIAGFANPADRERWRADDLKHMTDAIAHRGPDGENFLLEQGIGLGHRRLAIIDVAGGDNPLEDLDRRVSLVFNGEIYNHLDLRAELEARGARPRSGSDGEVILYGYLAWGLDGMLRRLRGMYGLALYDRRDRSLHLARDPLGIKPLFYAERDGGLLFGSEIKSLIAALDTPPALDPDSLFQAAALGYPMAPATIYQGIFSLEPGESLRFQNGRTTRSRYHELVFAPGEEKADPDELWHVTENAVRSHLMSEVPLGAFLSGGIDSSAVVTALSRLGGSGGVDAVTVGVMGGGLDERPYARELAGLLDGVRLHEETATPDVVDLLPKLIWHHDAPFADMSSAPTWLVCEAARRHVTVALSGDGGDENFAGYRRTRFDFLEDRVRRLIPSPIRTHLLGPLGRAWPRSPNLPQVFRAGTLFENLGRDWLDAYIHSLTRVPEATARRLIRQEHLTGKPLRTTFESHAAKCEKFDPLSRILYLDFKTWLANDILVKVDRMSMAHSLEVRVPLLDTDFVAYAARLPNEAKLNGSDGKHLFKKSLRGRVPDSVLDRPKQGFHLPLDDWLNGPLKPVLQDLINDRQRPVFDYLDPDVIGGFAREHAARQQNRVTELSFALILDAFLTHGSQTESITPSQKNRERTAA
ncbi:MAG: asparagine synthase (glutamine-hydrolyzing) [Geminicoccaceae bacterium]